MKSTSSSVIRPDPLRGRQAEQPPPDVAEIRLPEPTPPAARNHRPRLTRQDCRRDPDHTDVSVFVALIPHRAMVRSRVPTSPLGAVMVALCPSSCPVPGSRSAGRRATRRLVAVAVVASSSLMLAGTGPADAGAAQVGGPVPRLQRVAPAHRLVPRPTSVTDLTGAGFRVGPRTRVVVDGGAGAVRVARGVAQRLRRSTGFSLPVLRRSQPPSGALVLPIRPATALPPATGREGYRLVVRPRRVLIEA